MKRRLGSGRISPPAGFEPTTPWSEIGSANRSATRTLQRPKSYNLCTASQNSETELGRDMTKTNKISVRPAKTQISLGIRPVWSESSLCTQWVAKGPTVSSCEHRRFWSDWADAQANLSLRWAHTHFVGFIMSRPIYSNYCSRLI